jgi:membrane fusion protein, multidrug efflux system
MNDSTGVDHSNAEQIASEHHRSKLDRIRQHFFTVVVVVFVVGFVWREYSRTLFSYTSDAYTTTDVVVIAPAVAGIVSEMAVQNNQNVKKDDVLFVIDLKPFQYAVNLRQAEVNLAEENLKRAQDAVAEAQADAAAAEAALDDAKKTQGRISDLTTRGVASKQDLDNANESLNSSLADHNKALAAITVAQDDVSAATAQIESAKAELLIAQYDLERATVKAPDSGHIAPFDAKVGDYLDVGQRVLAIVTDSNWRVVANLPEQNLGPLAIGQTVWVMLSSKPWRLYEGKVRSFSRGISRSQDASRALPYVAPTTDWIRLSRRFPVEIDMGTLPEDLPFYMGADARVLILH